MGKQNFHGDIEKLYDPLTDTFKITSEKLTKTLKVTSINNIKAISDLNENVLELMNNNGIKAPFLTSSLVNRFNPERTSKIKMTKDPNSFRMDDYLKKSG